MSNSDFMYVDAVINSVRTWELSTPQSPPLPPALVGDGWK